MCNVICAALIGLCCVLMPRYGEAADARAVLIDRFDSPVYVTGAPGEPTLLFVVEQPGTIRVLDNETVERRPFLDLTSIVLSGGERGMLSIAFPPDYQSTRSFYVAFTNMTGDIELDEFKRTVSNHKVASFASRRTLLTIRHRGAANHNGGQLQFGPDGFLYLSTGDGGALNPRGWPAPDLHQLLGKMLRIDPQKRGVKPYTIPADNPYLGTGNRPEIFAYGFRNPWRFAFEGNNIIIADVGQTQFEEVNFLDLANAQAANFGWPDWEGRHSFDSPDVPPGPDPPTFPMLVYNHNGGRCAVIGGYVSHDPDLPALEGRYLYGDLCNGRIVSVVPDVVNQKALDRRLVGITVLRLSSFGLGPGNRLYITQITGELSRISPAD